jgi:hypothetical protein
LTALAHGGDEGLGLGEERVLVSDVAVGEKEDEAVAAGLLGGGEGDVERVGQDRAAAGLGGFDEAERLADAAVVGGAGGGEGAGRRAGKGDDVEGVDGAQAI